MTLARSAPGLVGRADPGRAAPTIATVAATSAIGILYVGSTVLTPLFPLYEESFGFSELVVTEIYASYVIGNLAVLFLLGRISDQIGRRPTTVAALALAALAALVFLGAHTVAWLFVGRVLNGFAAGLGAGALTAWIAELDPRGDRARASVVASSGNLAGLGLGAILGGVLARLAPWPLRTSYVVYLGLLAATIASLVATRETVERPKRAWRDITLRPRIGVPKELRLRFVAPAAMAFASFALGGFYAALAPGLLARRLHEPSVLVVGAVVAAFFGSASVIAATVPKAKPRVILNFATAFLVVAVALLVAADVARSLPCLVVATLAGGVALGLGYRGSLQSINEMAPPEKRAEIVSAYLLVCYTSNAAPVLGIGALSLVVGGEVAHAVFGGVLVALGALALVASRVAEKRAQR